MLEATAKPKLDLPFFERPRVQLRRRHRIQKNGHFLTYCTCSFSRNQANMVRFIKLDLEKLWKGCWIGAIPNRTFQPEGALMPHRSNFIASQRNCLEYLDGGAATGIREGVRWVAGRSASLSSRRRAVTIMLTAFGHGFQNGSHRGDVWNALHHARRAGLDTDKQLRGYSYCQGRSPANSGTRQTFSALFIAAAEICDHPHLVIARFIRANHAVSRQVQMSAGLRVARTSWAMTSGDDAAVFSRAFRIALPE